MFVAVWSLLYILYIGGNVLKDKFIILHFRVTKLVFSEYYYQYFDVFSTNPPYKYKNNFI